MFFTSLDLQSAPQGPSFESQRWKSRIPTPLGPMPPEESVFNRSQQSVLQTERIHFAINCIEYTRQSEWKNLFRISSKRIPNKLEAYSNRAYSERERMQNFKFERKERIQQSVFTNRLHFWTNKLYCNLNMLSLNKLCFSSNFQKNKQKTNKLCPKWSNRAHSKSSTKKQCSSVFWNWNIGSQMHQVRLLS